MVYYARKRKATRKPKKTYRRSVARAPNGSNSVVPFSDRIPVAPYSGRNVVRRHVYAESVVMPGTSATLPVGQRYSCNNMFDPNWSGTGHQPMGYDQMALMYGRYLVTDCIITATFQWATSTTANASVGARVSIFRQQSAIDSLITPLYPEERPKGTYATALLRPNSRESVTLKLRFSAKEAFSVVDPSDEHDAAGVSGAGPVLQNFFALSMLGANAYVDEVAYNAVIANVKIEYVTQWTRPNQLAQS